MNKKCPNCRLVNFAYAENCSRCGCEIRETENIKPKGGFLKTALVRRTAICLAVIAAVLATFYASLIFSSDPLKADERRSVEGAIDFLEEKGFTEEVFYLRNFAAFRANDNWLNASVEKENAYAATNFPFEIVTLYDDYFVYPADRTERAAILLHEARHLAGKDEADAYKFVWKNRKQLGWTSDLYLKSPVWRAVRKQTREYAPDLFICEFNDFGDCTE